jgi:uncharacterized membrane protein
MLVNITGGRIPESGRRRSLLVKTVGYRLVSVAVTAAVAFAVLRDAGAALDVGIWANVAKMGVYYAYERAWERGERPRADDRGERDTGIG